jgi:hypothetical protein
MMNVRLLSLFLVGGFVPAAAHADVFDNRPDLRFCAAGMIGGFDSGLEERACASYFALPSNYHFAWEK